VGAPPSPSGSVHPIPSFFVRGRFHTPRLGVGFARLWGYTFPAVERDTPFFSFPLPQPPVVRLEEATNNFLIEFTAPSPLLLPLSIVSRPLFSGKKEGSGADTSYEPPRLFSR